MKILDRYILRELLPPFFLGLLTFTFIVLLNKIFKLTDLIINKGVSVVDILRLLSYIMPSFFALTIPMAVLLAALVAFGRLSTDSEVTAFKATGISLYRMMRPVMMLSLAALAVTAYFSLYLGPEKARTFKKDLFVLAKTRAAIGIEAEVFNDTFKNLVIYTRKTPSANEMEGVFVSDERNPGEPYVIIARRGLLDIDTATGYASLELEKGSIHKKGAKADSYQHITFDTNTLTINLYDKFFSENDIKRGNRELTLGELREKAAALKQKGENYFPVLTEYYKRFCVPLACLVFGLVGPPLGMYSRRSGRTTGMTVALVIFAVYYALMKGGENLAWEGHLTPIVAVLLPDIIMLALAVYLIGSSARDKSIDFSRLPASLARMARLRGLRSKRKKRVKKGGR